MFRVIHVMGAHVSMYSVLLFIGIAAFFVVYFLLVEKGEKLDRFNSNRMLVVSAAGIAVLGLSALVFNSIFHSIEKKKLIIGGITWLGGVIGCFPFMVFAIHKFVPKAKGSALDYFSLLIPGLVLAHAFGRLGCFCGGCCYGKVTNGPFGVSFPAGSIAANQYPSASGGSLPVYPTQLFEAAFDVLLFAVMLIFRKKLKRYNIEIFLYSYGAVRFLLEFLRGDDRGSTGFALSPAQVICIIMVIAATLLILYRNGVIFKKYAEKCRQWREEAASAPPRTGKRKKGQSEDAVNALKELHKLKKAGAISTDEYEKKKNELLKRI